MSRQSWGGRRRRAVLAGVLSLLVASLAAPMVHAQTAPSSSSPSTFGCDQPAPDIDPATDPNAWRQRDLQNLQCATERQQDDASNPAFTSKWAAENARSSG